MDDNEVEIVLELSDKELQMVQDDAHRKGITVENVIRDLVLHQIDTDDLKRTIKEIEITIRALTQCEAIKEGLVFHPDGAAVYQELSRVLKKFCAINLTSSCDVQQSLKKLVASIEKAFDADFKES